ncbi:hypothetical protein F5876DRAFT_70677 [Lentinula aff. lateritia]|uniref:Uncharacterized protein n=1 Tax=Lentinula aff. lateritia TaxID=2804960 RepID=A0ACC1TI61_9AGAR|nr:hypothetical protein F5876DRAFT_70677 [Lentinula aff. lateritia]
MSPTPAQPLSRTPSPLLPTLTALGEVPSPAPESDGEVEMDQLAFTIESPSRPQLQLFETVFNTGRPFVASSGGGSFPLFQLCKVSGQMFLELHGTPTHQSTWGIPLSTWRQYDAALQARTSSTSTLLELNMLDEQDTAEADQQELREFLTLQQGEAVVAVKRKRDRSPLPVAGPSSKQVRSDGSKKCSRRRIPVEGAAQESPRRRSMAASTSTPALPRALPSSMEVSVRGEPMQGPGGLVQLAAAAEVQSGVVQRFASPSPVTSRIKGTGSDPLPSNMPPTSRSSLVPRTLIAHPYRTENQRLLARVRSLEFQLADSQRENSSLTTALRDTSHALDARQREFEQLRSSSHEVLQHEVEYRTVLDQFNALDRALSVFPGQTFVQRFQALEEELRVVERDRDVAVGELSTASRKGSELKTALLQQQGLVDKTNALATRQRRRLEEFREEIHRTRDRATFVEQMIKDRYISAIIEAVVAFLRRGLDSDNPDVVAHNFRLALDYMQTARGIHGDLYMRSISSIQWFFNNAVDEDEGLHRLVLEHSRFDNDGPFPTVAQHAGFAAPPKGSMEPPLHRRMLALTTAFPHRDGAGVGQYLPSDEPTSVVGEGVPSPPAPSHVTLFLPEQDSPTSPSPPPPSPHLPPLFGSVANLAIDLTGNDDELYKPEESCRVRVSEVDGMDAVPKEEPL